MICINSSLPTTNLTVSADWETLEYVAGKYLQRPSRNQNSQPRNSYSLSYSPTSLCNLLLLQWEWKNLTS